MLAFVALITLARFFVEMRTRDCEPFLIQVIGQISSLSRAQRHSMEIRDDDYWRRDYKQRYPFNNGRVERAKAQDANEGAKQNFRVKAAARLRT